MASVLITAFSELSIRLTERNRAFQIAVKIKIRISTEQKQARLSG